MFPTLITLGRALELCLAQAVLLVSEAKSAARGS